MMFALIRWEEAGTKRQLNGAFTLCQVLCAAQLSDSHPLSCRPLPATNAWNLPGEREDHEEVAKAITVCFVPRGIISWINWH